LALRGALQTLGRADVSATINPIMDARFRDALLTQTSNLEKFHKIFKPYTSDQIVSDLGLFVFCVNSNLPDNAQLNFAQGAVSPAEALKLQTQAREWIQQDRRKYAGGCKIVLVHHHPLPMPLTEGLGKFYEGEEFNLLKNSGSFLEICAEAGIDFILHGHKHMRGSAVLSFPERSDHAII